MNRWIEANAKLEKDRAEAALLVSIATAWRTGYYVRCDYFPKSLKGELDRFLGNDTGLSPEASAAQVKAWVDAGKNAANQGGAN